MNLLRSLIAIILILLIFPQGSYAYLDPGTGSYIIQIIIAGFLGGIFALKIFWKQIKIFFVKIFLKNHSNGKNKGQ